MRTHRQRENIVQFGRSEVVRRHVTGAHYFFAHAHHHGTVAMSPSLINVRVVSRALRMICVASSSKSAWDFRNGTCFALIDLKCITYPIGALR